MVARGAGDELLGFWTQERHPFYAGGRTNDRQDMSCAPALRVDLVYALGIPKELWAMITLTIAGEASDN
jgi:hypothetical protein